jgi:hypothetical protein
MYRQNFTPERRIRVALNALKRSEQVRFVEGVSREQILTIYHAEYSRDFRIRVEPFLSACRVTRLRKDQKK